MALEEGKHCGQIDPIFLRLNTEMLSSYLVDDVGTGGGVTPWVLIYVFDKMLLIADIPRLSVFHDVHMVPHGYRSVARNRDPSCQVVVHRIYTSLPFAGTGDERGFDINHCVNMSHSAAESPRPTSHF